MKCELECRDYWGKDSARIKRKKLFLLDMDGTIYNDNCVFEGTNELLEMFEQNNVKYVFVTNNSSRSVEDYIQKLHQMGIKVCANNFFTSSQATAHYLKKNYKGKKVYCQGTESLINELKDADIIVTDKVEDDIDIVLVGFDTELTAHKLQKTCEVLNRDLPFIATNPDLRCPVSFGYIPDCGSICAMIENATGKKPFYIGKPEPTMVKLAQEKFGIRKEDTVILGDRLYTDIEAGVRAGIDSICVLTGETTEEDIRMGSTKPTFTFNSIKEIYNILREE